MIKEWRSCFFWILWTGLGLRRSLLVRVCWNDFWIYRNPSKSHIRHTIPSAERGPGLLDSPTIFNFSADRLINGVRSPQTRQPGQSRTRVQSATSSYTKREVGTGRMEQTSLDSSPGLGRGRWVCFMLVLWTAKCCCFWTALFSRSVVLLLFSMLL